MSNHKSSLLEFAVPLIIGVAAGCVAGVLLAPAGGKTIRQKIKKEIKLAGELIKDGVEILADEADKNIEASVDLSKS
jgi:gas vesicle protein